MPGVAASATGDAGNDENDDTNAGSDEPAMRKLGIILLFLALGIGAVIAGYRVFQQPIQHEIALESGDAAFGSRKLNILVLGYQNDEANSDTILLAHLDIDRRTATLMSIPRDTWVAIPGHGHEKINAAIGYGGAKLSARVVSSMVGVPIDATIAIQPSGAKQLVDAMGGLNVNVERDMDYDDSNGQLHIHLKKGQQHLNGGEVLGYIRFRHDAESDWGRMRRQQQVLKNMLDEMSDPVQWTRLNQLLSLARKDMKTTLNDKQLAALLEIYRGVPQDNLRTLTMPGKGATVGEASVVLIDQNWAKIFGRLLFTKNEPPQDEVLVANATGVIDWNKTLVAALRGGGWNVQTFVDQPAKAQSRIMGTTAAGHTLAMIFPAAQHIAAKKTALVLGTDFAPQNQ